ncbi:Alpha-taxilin [Harpegnathos saltator]|uniref:Alpha-taxilin n=1 Tax=Harpegnathos saltator TaxID=610380 RepID=E2BVZ3_HARSA|nr:Alpha-taxilin [Harpegnathos saltator]
MNEKNNDNIKAEGPEMERKENEGECSTRKRTKEDRSKKKDDKRPAEQYSKILSHVSTPEEKLDVICKKYSQAVDENRRLSLALKHSEKKVELLLREREQLQIERSKSIMTRKRLENLCRELQKQNKIVKNESLQRVKEQEEIRKDLSEKFQGGLAQITTLMNQNIEKNAKMYEENLEINKKFKAVYEQVEQKEQQLLKVHQQMKLDLQVADAKLAKVKMEATAEKEALLKEKQQLLLKMTEYQTQIRELQATEVGLRSEISMYTDKYDEFQNALNRSNKIYGEFNVEMEKMTKKLYALEKETSLWKQRWANSHDALLAMAADKQSRDGEIAMLSKKLTLLQDLCKMFQCERTKLLAQLKTQSNKAPSPEPASTPALESQEVVKYMKQMDELPNLENTFEQLQASLADVSETMRKSSDVSSKVASANGTTEAEQKPETAETELHEKNAERLQTTPENSTEDPSEDCASSTLNGDTTKPTSYDSFVTLDYTVEAQEVEEQVDGQESFNTSKKKTTAVSNNESDESSNQSVESLPKCEEVKKDSHKLTELSKTDETNEEANEEMKLLENVETNDQSDVAEEKAYENIEEANGETTIEESDEIPQELSAFELEALEFLGSMLPQREFSIKETDCVMLLCDVASNHLEEQSECQIIENTSSNNKTHENAVCEDVEAGKYMVCANSSVVCNEIVSEDCTQNNPVAAVEGNIESIVETNNNNESATESISTLVKNTSEVSKTADVVAAAEDTTLVAQKKSEAVAETVNEVVESSFELTDNTIDTCVAKDVLSVDEENICKLATEATCILATKNVASSKEAPTEALTSESNCAEEKISKPTSIKVRIVS